MAMTVQHRTPKAHRMTVEEYLRFVDVNNLDLVELVNGVVYDVSPEGWAHSLTTSELSRILIEHYPDLVVGHSGSVRLSDDSLVEPDVSVFDIDRRTWDIGANYPSADSLLLAVEVSVTTRTYDIGPKLAAYARSGVPEYWVVNPQPGGDVLRFTTPADGAYQEVENVELPEGIASLGAVRTWLP